MAKRTKTILAAALIPIALVAALFAAVHSALGITD